MKNKKELTEKILKLAEIIKNSKYLVLKDFRGKDGLYSSLYKNKYRPEEILSIDFFLKNRKIFNEYVEEKLPIEGLKPNKGHEALLYLENCGILKTIITQNIDNLHQVSGNKNVIELHGTRSHFIRRTIKSKSC